jgi:hypothetical protein
MKFKIGMLVAATGAIVFGFQNCSRTSFGSADGTSSQEKSSLVAMANEPSTPNDANADLQQPGTGTSDDPTLDASGNPIAETPQLPTELPVGVPTVTPPPVQHGNGHGNDASTDVSVPPGQAKKGAADDEYIACILVDHGKSLKLGLITEQLGGVHSVAQSICITKSECLVQVATAFQVEGAYKRGYCAHNPHVRRLTNAQVDALLATVTPVPAPAP